MRLAPAPQVLSRRCLGKVLVRLPGEPTVELAGAAAVVWELLAPGASADEVVARLAAAHGADPATVGPEVRRLVADLLELRVAEEQPPSGRRAAT